MRQRSLPSGLAAALSLAFALPAEAEVVHREKSLYRNIYVHEIDGERCMSFGRYRGARQTCIDIDEPQRLSFDYYKMMLGALYLNPAPGRALVIGLGGGALPGALQRLFPALQMDVVEIDPAVVRVARKYFGFQPGPRTRVIEQDGRVFVKRALQQGLKYDLVLLDAFDHEYIPEHLLTREFLAEVKGVLADQGVVAANTFSHSRLYALESATYHSVFGPFYNLQGANRVILARRNGLPAPAELAVHAAALESKLRPLGTGRDWLMPKFSVQGAPPPGTRVLSDQYAPSNLLNLPR